MGLPFTHISYTSLLSTLLERGYQFQPFSEAQHLLARHEQFVLMRHDIDFDLEKAAEMALLEKENGVRATYFFMLRTEHYNIFSKDGTAVIREILGYGHYLGLHFDCASYPNDLKATELAQACRKEVEILEGWFGVPVNIVSYHRPGPEVLKGGVEISDPYPHTYLPLYTKRIHYCSDSRGEWRHGNPLDTEAFRNRKPLHILIHPVWWCREVTTPLDVLIKLQAIKRERMECSFRENCTVYR